MSKYECTHILLYIPWLLLSGKLKHWSLSCNLNFDIQWHYEFIFFLLNSILFIILFCFIVFLKKKKKVKLKHVLPCFPASQTVLFFLENYFSNKVCILFCFVLFFGGGCLFSCPYSLSVIKFFSFRFFLTWLSLATIKSFQFSLPLGFFWMLYLTTYSFTSLLKK